MDNMSSLYKSVPSSTYLSLTNDVANFNLKNYLASPVQALPLVQLGPGGPIGSLMQTHVFRPLIYSDAMILPADSDFSRIIPLSNVTPMCKNASVTNVASHSAFSPFSSPIMSDPKAPNQVSIPISSHLSKPESSSSAIPVIPHATSLENYGKTVIHVPGMENSNITSSSHGSFSHPSNSIPLHIPVVSPYVIGNSSPGFKQASTSSFFPSFSSSSPLSSFNNSMSLVEIKKPTTIHTGKVKRLKRKDKVHTCEHAGCGFSFPTRFSLKRHQKRHTGEKPFLCNWVENGEPCGTRFAEKSTLKRHLQTHTGEKPFKCSRPGCDRVFADRLNCHRHERRHRSAWVPTSQL